MWISEAAEAAGVNVETLRYYERRGLLPRPRRPVQGYREYSEEPVRLVRFIKHAQDLGFSLEEIRELARLSRSGERDRERARAVAERKLANIDRKLTQLQAIRRALEQLVLSGGSYARVPPSWRRLNVWRQIRHCPPSRFRRFRTDRVRRRDRGGVRRDARQRDPAAEDDGWRRRVQTNDE